MGREREYSHPTLGSYKVRKSRRAKHLSIRVDPTGEVTAVIPHHLPFKRGAELVIKNSHLIEQRVEKLAQKLISSQIDPIDNFTLPLINGKIVLRNPIDREQLLSQIDEKIRGFAKLYLPERIEQLSNQVGLKPVKVRLKNNRTNWGSCSTRGNINLNIHLVRLPQHLCDYVILHELAHLKHPNHGSSFYKLLNSWIGGRAKEYSSQLKSYTPKLWIKPPTLSKSASMPDSKSLLISR